MSGLRFKTISEVLFVTTGVTLSIVHDFERSIAKVCSSGDCQKAAMISGVVAQTPHRTGVGFWSFPSTPNLSAINVEPIPRDNSYDFQHDNFVCIQEHSQDCQNQNAVSSGKNPAVACSTWNNNDKIAQKLSPASNCIGPGVFTPAMTAPLNNIEESRATKARSLTTNERETIPESRKARERTRGRQKHKRQPGFKPSPLAGLES
jgi:hypothetical protein